MFFLLFLCLGVVWLSYADLDGVPSQTAGTSSLLASDWNTYVRDNFDSIKFGHVVVADNTAKSAISAVEGIMVYQSDVDTLFLYTGSAWVEAVGTVSLVDLAVTTAKINDLGVTTGKIAASAVTSAKIADDTIVNADVNSAAAIAYSKLNLASSVTSADIVDSTIVLGDLAAALQAFLTPTGTVSAFAGASAPTGYLLCDGVATHSTTTYAALFAVVGYTYGGSGGVFGVPDLQGRTIAGLGTHADVNTLNDNDGISTVANRSPKHSHSLTGGVTATGAVSTGGHSVDHTHGFTDDTLTQTNQGNQLASGSFYGRLTFASTSSGDNTGGASVDHTHRYDHGHTNTFAVGVGSGTVDTMPFITLNYIIKV